MGYIVIEQMPKVIICLYGFQLGFFNRKAIGKLFCNKPLELISPAKVTNGWHLLRDRSILILCMAICFSTMGMSVLEPTLPVWLIETIDPPKWQLGLVFVPDSLGYFIGTNFFGAFALRIGRWKTSMSSLGLIGFSCLILPLCKAIWQLALPHFCLGLGLGIVDASLLPLLALFSEEYGVDVAYGTVYALAQTSVALAYSLGPLVGGQLVRLIGFPDLMRCIGFLNLILSPFLLILGQKEEKLSRYIPLLTDFDGRNDGFNDMNKGGFYVNPSSSCSTSDSSFEESKEKRWTKRVRFQRNLSLVNVPTEKFMLSGIQSKSYSIQPEEYMYERFPVDLDSD